MASDRSLEVTVEREAIADQGALLADVQRRLARRHGARFVELDRAIDRLLEDGFGIEMVELEPLGPGLYVAHMPRVAALLARARLLGVLDG